jgi:hypothetical protein
VCTTLPVECSLFNTGFDIMDAMLAVSVDGGEKFISVKSKNHPHVAVDDDARLVRRAK